MTARLRPKAPQGVVDRLLLPQELGLSTVTEVRCPMAPVRYSPATTLLTRASRVGNVRVRTHRIGPAGPPPRHPSPEARGRRRPGPRGPSIAARRPPCQPVRLLRPRASRPV